MDLGKKKFGGLFTEEAVENVKTLLPLIPLLVCISITINAVEDTAVHLVREHGRLTCVKSGTDGLASFFLFCSYIASAHDLVCCWLY